VPFFVAALGAIACAAGHDGTRSATPSASAMTDAIGFARAHVEPNWVPPAEGSAPRGADIPATNVHEDARNQHEATPHAQRSR
jgi:hypothetical protein